MLYRDFINPTPFHVSHHKLVLWILSIQRHVTAIGRSLPAISDGLPLQPLYELAINHAFARSLPTITEQWPHFYSLQSSICNQSNVARSLPTITEQFFTALGKTYAINCMLGGPCLPSLNVSEQWLYFYSFWSSMQLINQS